MHLGRWASTVLGLCLLAVGAAAGVAHGARASDVAGHVYVNDNTAGRNTIAAFDRHADGTLVPLEGSPFATGGVGTGTSVGSQGALQVTADGRFLVAVDAGSSQVSTLAIRHDGTLRRVPGGSVPSGGVRPVSVAIHGSLVYVANQGNGAGGSDYTGFTLGHDGRLTPLPGSSVPLSSTALPGDVLFNSTGANLAGIEVGTTDPSTFLIDSFTVDDSGRLTPAPGSPFPAQAPGPFGSEFSPAEPTHLYVSNAHGGSGAGSVSAFAVGRRGSLTPIGGSPYADGQTAPCWVEITHDGRVLFTVNTGSASISSYRILADGSLGLLSTTPMRGGPGLQPFDARLDPSGSDLYVVDSARAAVSAFAVDGGRLSELGTSPFHLPVGATPFGIVVTPSAW